MSLVPLHDGGCDLPVDEPLLGVSKLTKLMSDHVLGDSNGDVVFTIVHHETNAADDDQLDTAYTNKSPTRQNLAELCTTGLVF